MARVGQPSPVQLADSEGSVEGSIALLCEGGVFGDGDLPPPASHGTVNRLAKVMMTVTARTMNGSRRWRRDTRSS